jgi:acyl-CoA synthetase (AMP-forming)/AMP-acid ligase II
MASFTFAPLTPAAFLHRSARVFPDRVAIVDGSRQWTYREFARRCDALRRALDPAELAAHVRGRLAGFKIPREFIFTDLPRTSTGKAQKNVLRTRAAERRNGSR